MSELTPTDLNRIRAIRERRVRAAERHKVAIGWVALDGTVPPGAPRLTEDQLKKQREFLGKAA